MEYIPIPACDFEFFGQNVLLFTYIYGIHLHEI